jgi:hypothetical protein
LLLIRLTDALPGSFEAVLEAADKAAEHQPDSGMEHWQMQQDIIQQDFAPLLARFVEAEDHQVCIQLGGARPKPLLLQGGACCCYPTVHVICTRLA